MQSLTLQVRSHVETQIGLIAKGQADKDAVVAHTLQQFSQISLKFLSYHELIEAIIK